ncbi:Uncharacterised protein [Escherichia coli]|uniref:Uncharacterized protein n=1 Tax=Escherichia coli TaxID=562 RepID=A0A376W1I0_ECOLX|nr:Uncharacterised protein [Escherichia coli]
MRPVAHAKVHRLPQHETTSSLASSKDSLITQTQGGELWNIHCRSLVGVIKAEDILSQACCNALSL